MRKRILFIGLGLFCLFASSSTQAQVFNNVIEDTIGSGVWTPFSEQIDLNVFLDFAQRWDHALVRHQTENGEDVGFLDQKFNTSAAFTEGNIKIILDFTSEVLQREDVQLYFSNAELQDQFNTIFAYAQGQSGERHFGDVTADTAFRHWIVSKFIILGKLRETLDEPNFNERFSRLWRLSHIVPNLCIWFCCENDWWIWFGD